MKLTAVLDMFKEHFRTGHPAWIFTKATDSGSVEYFYNYRRLLRVDRGEDLLEAEKGLYNTWLRAGIALSDVVVKGEALKRVPHGFVCIHGPKESVERAALLATEPVFVFMVGYRYDLEDRLKAAFQLAGKPEGGGVLRMEYIYEKMAVPPTDYMLLVREGGDRLTIPGGKRHLGESSVQCAQRELKEETGLQYEITSEPVYSDLCRANYYAITLH